MGNIHLTDEEKVIKKYYDAFVNKSGFKRVNKDMIIDLLREYSAVTMKGTRFEDTKIEILEEKDKNTFGSMSVHRTGDATLTINLDRFQANFNTFNKDKKFVTFYKLMNTANHEFKHLFQEKDSKEFIMTTNGHTISQCLEFSREKLAQLTDREEFYDSEVGNYKDTIIEGDARRTGCLKTVTQLLRIFPNMKKEYKNYLINKTVQSLKEDNVEYSELKYESGKNKGDRDEVTSYYVDEIIATHPKILDTYNILRFEYHSDGSRRSFEELMQIRDSRLAKLDANNKITNETRKNIKEQVNTAMSQIMLNELKSKGKKEVEYLCRKYGKEKILNELEFVEEGLYRRLYERSQNYKKYREFFNNNKELIDKKISKKIREEYEELYKKAKTRDVYDSNNEKYTIIDSYESRLISAATRYVKENEFKRYGPFEMDYIDKERENKRQETLAELKLNNRRRVAKKDKEEYERRKAEIEKQNQDSKKPINQLKKMFGKSNDQMLLDGNTRVFELYEKREKLEKLKDNKEELELKFEEIRSNSENILMKAEKYIDDDKVKEDSTIIKKNEEQEYEKRI